MYHGPNGLKNISRRINLVAQMAGRIFEHYGFNLLANTKEYSPFFDTITIIDCDAHKLDQAFLKHGININVISDKEISLSFSEITKLEDLKDISKVLASFTTETELNVNAFPEEAKSFHDSLERKGEFMKQKIFNSVHS